jgi:hypothetical protein
VVTGYHAWPTRVCRCLRACSYDSTATRPRPRSHETARPDIRPVPRAHHTRTPPCLVSSTCMSLPSVPACHIYLPSAASCTTAHFIPHSNQPKTRLPLQSPYSTSTAVVVPSNSSTFARQLPIVTRHHHSARPTSSQNGRTTLCPPHTNYLTTARSHAEIVSCSLTLSHTKLPVLPSDYHIQNRPPFRNYPRPRLICFPKWLPHEASLRCDHLYTLPRQTGCLLLAPLPPCVQSHLSLLATSHHASKLSNHLRPAQCTPDMAMVLAARTPIL